MLCFWTMIEIEAVLFYVFGNWEFEDLTNLIPLICSNVNVISKRSCFHLSCLSNKAKHSLSMLYNYLPI